MKIIFVMVLMFFLVSCLRVSLWGLYLKSYEKWALYIALILEGPGGWMTIFLSFVYRFNKWYLNRKKYINK